MYIEAVGRPPVQAELDDIQQLALRLAELRGVGADGLLAERAIWQDVAHAIFNLKQFIYIQ